jgi:dipeptidase
VSIPTRLDASQLPPPLTRPRTPSAPTFHSIRTRGPSTLRLINPGLKLSPEYDDLRLDAPYPFSVKPARPVTAKDLFAWHRDWYQGTPFDVTRAGDVAGGPWSTPDRYGGGDAEASLPGAFERTIALYRTTYTHVLQTRAWLPDHVGGVTWFGPHAAHGTCFVPVFAGCDAAPSVLRRVPSRRHT